MYNHRCGTKGGITAMIELTNAMALQMSSTNRLLCEEMLRRGWKVQIPYEGVSHFYVDRGDGGTVHLHSSSPPGLSYAAAQLSIDKYATSEVLNANGLRQLPMQLVDDYRSDEAYAFLRENKRIVVKPLDGAHGNGITTNVTAKDQLQAAIEVAFRKSSASKVLLQKQLIGSNLKDIRILVINGCFNGAIHRVPARVQGDGVATVEELIVRENQQSYRGKPYQNKLAVIDLESARVFLGEEMQSVPETGKEVTVLGVANYGAGGELMDVTDSVPEWMKVEAVRIADVLELPVAGIDYMVSGKIADAAETNEETAVVIEVNKTPSLCIHDEPTVGMNRGATKAYVDYVATL